MFVLSIPAGASLSLVIYIRAGGSPSVWVIVRVRVTGPLRHGSHRTIRWELFAQFISRLLLLKSILAAENLVILMILLQHVGCLCRRLL